MVPHDILIEMRALLGEDRVRIIAPHNPVEPLQAIPSFPSIVVRAWWNDVDGVWEAIEGSHRLAAAMQMKAPIEIHPVNLDDAFPNHNLDGSPIYGDPGFQVVTVRQALEIFKDWGPRPTYQLDATVRST